MSEIIEGDRKRVTTRKQFEYLVAWMEKNPNVAKGLRFGENYLGKKEVYKRLWYHLTTKLNNLGPPVRTTTEWQKVWTDFKLKIKKKLINNSKEFNNGNDGRFKLYKLASLEQRAINFLPLKKNIRSAKKFASNQGENELYFPPIVGTITENPIAISAEEEIDCLTFNDEMLTNTTTGIVNDDSTLTSISSAKIIKAKNQDANSIEKEFDCSNFDETALAGTFHNSISTSVSETNKKRKIKKDKKCNNKNNLLKEIFASIKIDLKYSMKMYKLKKERFEFYKEVVEMREKRKLEELALKKEILNYKNRKLQLEESKVQLNQQKYV